MVRKRTTFRNIPNLEVGTYYDWFTYGPECAEVYPVALKMLQSAREIFESATLPIIKAGRQKYPKQAWWLIDKELAAEYDEAWMMYKAWRYEAYRMMELAAWNDTSAFYVAAETGRPWPFLPAESPKVAHDEGTDFSYLGDEPIPSSHKIIVTSETLGLSA